MTDREQLQMQLNVMQKQFNELYWGAFVANSINWKKMEQAKALGPQIVALEKKLRRM